MEERCGLLAAVAFAHVRRPGPANPVATLPVKYRDDRVAVVPQRAVSRVVRADERLNLIVRGLPTTIDGPVAAGSNSSP